MERRRKIILGLALAAVFIAGLFWLVNSLNNRLQANYRQIESPKVTDRDSNPLFSRKNGDENFAIFSDDVPNDFANLLITKEDRWFFWHKGINPISIAKNFAANFGIGDRMGSSTISQQLAKLLLKNENRRTLKNKISEVFFALALESKNSKNKILTEYANSVYFGNQIQGFATASLAYFATNPEALSKEQIFQLLATISNPGKNNPLFEANIENAKILAKNMGVEIGNDFALPARARKNLNDFLAKNNPVFELAGYLSETECSDSQKTTLDAGLNEKLRQVISQELETLKSKKAKNAAAMILSLPGNEILALAGSPNPESPTHGYQINMLSQPRQIGSTVKPFIYLKGFEKGMRPYTLIDDREYKYPAGFGFSIYPENYDRAYHGLMTAHYALANSINVAAAKTLEFAGTDEVVNFLRNDLNIPAPQDYSTYQMGIAMGALETDLMSLARAFTIFPNAGRLENLNLFDNSSCNSKNFGKINKIAVQDDHIQLINKILSDRAIAQDQFAYASDLNLPVKNYALKTGTSHDYTDSWVVGYTPDFLVAVWVGNADATATEGLSGQLGAGKIWSSIMNVLIGSRYDKKTIFDFSKITEYPAEGTINYGLKSDDFERAKNVVQDADKSLILKPHDSDIYQYDDRARIILKSRTAARWLINGENYGAGDEIIFSPPAAGEYKIAAQSGDLQETITVYFTSK